MTSFVGSTDIIIEGNMFPVDIVGEDDDIELGLDLVDSDGNVVVIGVANVGLFSNIAVFVTNTPVLLTPRPSILDKKSFK